MANHLDIFARIESGAHGGAFGHNPLPIPTPAQCEAGNYKVGRVSIYGLPIAIEQPRNSFRSGIDPSGKEWRCRLAAHYGYFSGTKGADGDAVDCFIGPWPQAEVVYVINQNVGGKFDEHKVMVCFVDEDMARRAYLDSYDRGWNGLKSLVPMSISQFKWWLKHGNKSRPAVKDYLPFEGHEAMKMKHKVYWGQDGSPVGMTLDQALYEIRRDDAADGLVFDSLSDGDIHEIADEMMALDSLVTPYAAIERTMTVLNAVMVRSGGEVKPLTYQITAPYKFRGVVNVAAIWELSDGQTVSILMHNPDSTPNKLAPTDELVSWKWLLNKKDITIVVAPEKGVDLNVREVSRRIMRLAEKNSAAFQRANAKRADQMQRIQALKDEISSMESELAAILHKIEVAEIDDEERKSRAEIVSSLNPGDIKLINGKWWVKTKSGDSVSFATEEFAKNASASINEAINAETGTTKAIGISGRSKRYESYVNTIRGASSTDDLPSGFKQTIESDSELIPGESADLIEMIGNAFAPEFDPTSPDGFARVTAEESLQLKYQDVLDNLFQGRISSVRSALVTLGWFHPDGTDGSELQEYLAKGEAHDGYDGLLSVSTTKVGSGNNVVGVRYQLTNIGPVPFELSDDLSKTPDEMASTINEQWRRAHDSGAEARLAEEQATLAAQAAVATVVTPSPVTVTGNELGEFPDTEEGKKAMRKEAALVYDQLINEGQWVSCPALGADVELRTKGRKKALSSSADIRKLKIIPRLKDLIRVGVKIGHEKANYDQENSPNILGYQTMRSPVKIGDEALAVRFVLGRDDKGSYHYDHTIHSLEVIFDSTNENGPAEASPHILMGGSQGFSHSRSAVPGPSCLLPAEPSAGHQDNSILDDAGLIVNKEVFNLFIEGEVPEVVEEEGEEQSAVTIGDISHQLGQLGWATSVDENGLLATIYDAKNGAVDVSILSRYNETGVFDVDGDRIDLVEYPTAQAIARHIDAEYRYDDDTVADAIRTEDHIGDFPGKTFEFAKSALIVRDTSRRLGGDIHFGDYNYSMSDGLFDDAGEDKGAIQEIPSLPYGICAQIIQYGNGIGRARIDEDGATTIYTGMSGAFPVDIGGAPSAPSLGYGGIVDMVESLFAAVSQTAPEVPVVVEPPPAENPQMSDDRLLFQSVIDGTVSDIAAQELADQLEAAFLRHPDDTEMASLFEMAVDAYQAAMMAATANLA